MSTSLPSTLRDSRGNNVALGKELGRGGEGAVFDVAGNPTAVAKIYIKPPSRETADKLAAMVSKSTPELLKIAAWPTDILRDSGGQVTGFLMPKVGGFKAIFRLYLPKPRMQEFPTADWRFLIHAAANTARAFATVHNTGLVIGDVNHGNLVVTDDATVKMIDCDSFQVASGNKTWFCTVGVGTHQPPEMQAQASYAGILRTPNQDRFGLAVLIFQLLCMARHPFSGRYNGKGDPPTIEDAIKASRYAYSRDAARTQMTAPPGSLPMDALTPEIRDLFEAAFAPGAAKQGRPTAEAWVTALNGLASALTVCGVNRAHYYRKGLNTCPWCEIENASNVTLFPVIFVAGQTATAGGIAALWQEIQRVPDPPALSTWPPSPAPSGRPSPVARAVGRKARTLRIAAWAAVAVATLLSFGIASPGVRVWLVPSLGVCVFATLWHARKTTAGPFRTQLQEVQRDWEAVRSAWNSAQADRTFAESKAALVKLKADYDRLPVERAQRLQKLNEQLYNRQLHEFLDKFLIADAKIPGIGDAKVAALASNGIDTAADVTLSAVERVQGFGTVLSSKLVAWRKVRENSFHFDPKRGVTTSDIAAMDRDLTLRNAKLQQEMSAGLGRLRTIGSTATHQRARLIGHLAELQPRYAQALTDASVGFEDGSASIRLACISGVAACIAIFTAQPSTIATLGSVRTAAVVQPSVGVTVRPQPITPPAPAQAPAPAPAKLSFNTFSHETSNPAPVSTPVQTPVVQPSAAPVPPALLTLGDVKVRLPANLRSAADSASSVVQVVAAGSILHVYRREHGWLQVGNAEPMGWIFSGLADEVR